MPPITGAAIGFITSAPVLVLHMMGNRLATTVETVMTLGRKRNSAPSFTAASRSPGENLSPISSRLRCKASSSTTSPAPAVPAR